jgi:hypothetical protein
MNEGGEKLPTGRAKKVGNKNLFFLSSASNLADSRNSPNGLGFEKIFFLILFLGIGQFVAPRVVVFGYDRARHDPIYLRMPRKFRFRRFPECLCYGPKLRNGIFALRVVESFGTGSFGPPC